MNKMSKTKKVVLALTILFVLFAVFSAGLIYYTERPEFCNTCHLMKPYYKAWSESPHNKVPCLKCHIEPGFKSHVMGKVNGLMQVAEFVTGRYSEKPVAEVNDVICLQEGCHTRENVIGRKIMFKNKVQFKHGTHFKKHPELGVNISLECTTCHMWLTYDKHIAVDENTCFICHFKNVPITKITGQCLNCHTEIEGSQEHREYLQEGMHCMDCHTTIKTTNAPVLVQLCYFCHADSKKIEKIKDRELLHKSHIPQNNADCMNCHELIKHGKEGS